MSAEESGMEVGERGKVVVESLCSFSSGPTSDPLSVAKDFNEALSLAVAEDLEDEEIPHLGRGGPSPLEEDLAAVASRLLQEGIQEEHPEQLLNFTLSTADYDEDHIKTPGGGSSPSGVMSPTSSTSVTPSSGRKSKRLTDKEIRERAEEIMRENLEEERKFLEEQKRLKMGLSPVTKPETFENVCSLEKQSVSKREVSSFPEERQHTESRSIDDDLESKSEPVIVNPWNKNRETTSDNLAADPLATESDTVRDTTETPEKTVTAAAEDQEAIQSKSMSMSPKRIDEQDDNSEDDNSRMSFPRDDKLAQESKKWEEGSTSSKTSSTAPKKGGPPKRKKNANIAKRDDSVPLIVKAGTLEDCMSCLVMVDRVSGGVLERFTGSRDPPVWIPKDGNLGLPPPTQPPPPEPEVEKKEKKLELAEVDFGGSSSHKKSHKKRKHEKEEGGQAEVVTPVESQSQNNELDERALYNIRREQAKKRRKETSVSRLIKERSLPKAHNVRVKDGYDKCDLCERYFDPEETDLGYFSAFCSLKCLNRIVTKACKLINNPDARVSVIDKRNSRMFTGPHAPTLSNLESFLRASPSCTPMLPQQAKVEKTEADSTYQEMGQKGRNPPNTVRLSVRKAIMDKLQEKAKEASELLLLEKDVREIAIRVEEALFKSCGEQVMSNKYKTWFRAFLVNLKMNKELSLSILSGDMSPTKIVELSNSEMGAVKYTSAVAVEVSAENILSEQPQQSARSLLEQKLEERLQLQMEEEEESESKDGPSPEPPHGKGASVSGDSYTANESQRPPTPTPAPKAPARKGDILADLLEGVDTTKKHKSHLFDLNCRICTGVEKPEQEKKKEDLEKKKRKAYLKGKKPMDVDTDYEQYLYLTGPDAPEWAKQVTSWNSGGVKRLELWKGSIAMAKYSFECTAIVVSGDPYRIETFLPVGLNVVGRIAPEIVWSYVDEVKRTRERDMIIAMFEIPSDTYEKAQYAAFFKNIMGKGKFVVVGNCDPNLIKDFYIFPCPAGTDPPALLLPFKGPGLDKEHEDVLLAVIVANRSAVAPTPIPTGPSTPPGETPRPAHPYGHEVTATPRSPFTSGEKGGKEDESGWGGYDEEDQGMGGFDDDDSPPPPVDTSASRGHERNHPPERREHSDRSASRGNERNHPPERSAHSDRKEEPLRRPSPAPMYPHSPTQVPVSSIRRAKEDEPEAEGEDAVHAQFRDVIYGGMGLSYKKPELPPSNTPYQPEVQPREFVVGMEGVAQSAQRSVSTMRHSVQNLVKDIELCAIPAQIAKKVQDFLAVEGKFSEEEESIVLSLLNEKVDQEKRRQAAEEVLRHRLEEQRLQREIDELKRQQQRPPSPPPHKSLPISQIVAQALEQHRQEEREAARRVEEASQSGTEEMDIGSPSPPASPARPPPPSASLLPPPPPLPTSFTPPPIPTSRTEKSKNPIVPPPTDRSMLGDWMNQMAANKQFLGPGGNMFMTGGNPISLAYQPPPPPPPEERKGKGEEGEDLEEGEISDEEERDSHWKKHDTSHRNRDKDDDGKKHKKSKKRKEDADERYGRHAAYSEQEDIHKLLQPPSPPPPSSDSDRQQPSFSGVPPPPPPGSYESVPAQPFPPPTYTPASLIGGMPMPPPGPPPPWMVALPRGGYPSNAPQMSESHLRSNVEDTASQDMEIEEQSPENAVETEKSWDLDDGWTDDSPLPRPHAHAKRIPVPPPKPTVGRSHSSRRGDRPWREDIPEEDPRDTLKTRGRGPHTPPEPDIDTRQNKFPPQYNESPFAKKSVDYDERKKSWEEPPTSRGPPPGFGGRRPESDTSRRNERDQRPAPQSSERWRPDESGPPPGYKDTPNFRGPGPDFYRQGPPPGFDPSYGPGPGFDGPPSYNAPRFDGPGPGYGFDGSPGGPRFDGPGPRYFPGDFGPQGPRGFGPRPLFDGGMIMPPRGCPPGGFDDYGGPPPGFRPPGPGPNF